jgi:molybdenum cofactor biosynthesis enzyme MoaA
MQSPLPPENLALYEICTTLRCDSRCFWNPHCRGASGPEFAPGEGGQHFESKQPGRVRLIGGDAFVYGDLLGWVRWVRERPVMFLEVEGPASSLTGPGVVERLVAARPDAVQAVLPALDAGVGAEALLAGLAAVRAAGLNLVVVIPVNAVTAARLPDTLATLRAALGAALPVVLRRVPDPAAPWSELAALQKSLVALAADPDRAGALSVDPSANWGACLLPAVGRLAGLVSLSRTARRDGADVAPACAGCALRPRCTWAPHEAPPLEAMSPLSHDEALALHRLSPHLSLEHEPATKRTRRDRSSFGLPDLLCFAPFTSLVMCDVPNAPVPCAESWVRTEMTSAEQAAALGVPVEEVERRNAESYAKWGYPAFVPANEDWSLDEMWNGPLVLHMRRQMLEGGPTDRCRGNCRPILGVEEPFFDALTRPDDVLTPEIVANRRHLIEEVREGRSVLTAKPLELVLGVASHCNISCGFCSGPLGSYGELTERRMHEVIALLPSLMTLSVIGPGEPLMSVRFPKLLEHINDRGYPALQVSLTTNGTLMTRSWIERHSNVRFNHIRISLNAGSAATHERMTGKKFFDRLMASIEALAERKERSDSRFELTLSCVLSDFVLGDLGNFAEIVDRANANIVVEPMYGNSLNLSPYVKADKLRALRDECAAVSRAFEVRNPKVARAFRAMEQFAGERLRTRNLTVLPHH